MLVSDFNYRLPEELIAQEPLPDRSGSRLLHLQTYNRQPGEPQGLKFEDRLFRDFPELLRPSDLLVFNNTRVFPARLHGRRAGLKAQVVSPGNPGAREFLHGRIEVLLARQIASAANDWECLVRPGRKIGTGEHLFLGPHDELRAEVLSRGSFGERTIRFEPTTDFFALLEKLGHVPLPPYISRADSVHDRERYQTVYAREVGSVAAPTAGLHFTAEILERIREKGIETTEVTLHVGLGTFQPVRGERVEDHPMHSESYSISEESAEKINRARADQRRVVAIGTTTVRTLEHAAQQGEGVVRPGARDANLFIYPGYRFRIVGAMLTNFHLPQSTLLMLVCAFAGRENVLRAYQHAVTERYRFYSYGDCMFVE